MQRLLVLDWTQNHGPGVVFLDGAKSMACRSLILETLILRHRHILRHIEYKTDCFHTYVSGDYSVASGGLELFVFSDA